MHPDQKKRVFHILLFLFPLIVGLILSKYFFSSDKGSKAAVTKMDAFAPVKQDSLHADIRKILLELKDIKSELRMLRDSIHPKQIGAPHSSHTLTHYPSLSPKTILEGKKQVVSGTGQIADSSGNQKADTQLNKKTHE